MGRSWIVALLVVAAGCEYHAALRTELPAQAITLGSEEACKPMSRGETRYVIGKSLTDMHVSYRLKFEGFDFYRIALNLHFKEPSYEMMQITENCLKDAERFLKGPNGEMIAIEIDQSDSRLPVLAPIEVVNMDRAASSSFHENSLRWARHLSCGQILHEVFHHLGLVDEYVWGTHACRAIGPTDSTMYSGNFAWNEIQQKWSSSSLTGEEAQSLSLLKPAHFRALIQPGCRSANEGYYRCARFAYTDTFGPYICPHNVPKECRTLDWLK